MTDLCHSFHCMQRRLCSLSAAVISEDTPYISWYTILFIWSMSLNLLSGGLTGARGSDGWKGSWLFDAFNKPLRLWFRREWPFAWMTMLLFLCRLWGNKFRLGFRAKYGARALPWGQFPTALNRENYLLRIIQIIRNTYVIFYCYIL